MEVKMNIVFLDKNTLGEGLSFSELKKQGNYKEYGLTSKDDVYKRIRDAEVIICNKVYIGKDEMDNSPNLKLICVSATGYNNIDIEEARKRGIIVANVKNYSTESVVQMVFAYIFEFENKVSDYDREVKNGTWSRAPFFTFYKNSFDELSAKTIGIIGYGNIGKKVEQIAKAFGMKIMIAALDSQKKYTEDRVSLKMLLQESDIVTIHVPLNEKTKDLISKKELNYMKESSIIINTARGGIINEKDLFEALSQNKIKGAAIDVLTQEPPIDGNILFGLDNIIITPHNAWASVQSRQRLLDGIVENIKKYTMGKRNEICVY